MASASVAIQKKNNQTRLLHLKARSDGHDGKKLLYKLICFFCLNIVDPEKMTQTRLLHLKVRSDGHDDIILVYKMIHKGFKNPLCFNFRQLWAWSDI